MGITEFQILLGHLTTLVVFAGGAMLLVSAIAVSFLYLVRYMARGPDE